MSSMYQFNAPQRNSFDEDSGDENNFVMNQDSFFIERKQAIVRSEPRSEATVIQGENGKNPVGDEDLPNFDLLKRSLENQVKLETPMFSVDPDIDSEKVSEVAPEATPLVKLSIVEERKKFFESKSGGNEPKPVGSQRRSEADLKQRRLSVLPVPRKESMRNSFPLNQPVNVAEKQPRPSILPSLQEPKEMEVTINTEMERDRQSIQQEQKAMVDSLRTTIEETDKLLSQNVTSKHEPIETGSARKAQATFRGDWIAKIENVAQSVEVEFTENKRLSESDPMVQDYASSPPKPSKDVVQVSVPEIAEESVAHQSTSTLTSETSHMQTPTQPQAQQFSARYNQQPNRTSQPQSAVRETRKLPVNYSSQVRAINDENQRKENTIPDGFRMKTHQEISGRSRTPGYLTPTEASRSKNRTKMSPRPMTPTQYPSSASRRPPTEPRTPNLATNNRRRSNSGQLISSTTRELEALAQERREKQERKEKEQMLLRAVSVSRPAPVRAPTEPQPFRLRTDVRAPYHQPSQSYHTSAEIASQILRRDSRLTPVGTPTHSSTSAGGLVEPHSPQLKTQSRIRGTSWKSSEELEWERIQKEKLDLQRERERKERQVLNVSMNSSNISSDSKRPLTQPQPFPLESLERHERAQREFQQRVEQEQRESEMKRHFSARKIPPTLERQPMVVRPQQPLTQPVAPTCVERAMVTEEMRRAKLEREALEAERARQFHARNLPKTTYEPDLLVAPSESPLVEPMEFDLRTNQRAERRSLLEKQQREQFERDEKRRAVEEAKLKSLKDKELKEFRKSLVHRPLPVPETSRFSSKYEIDQTFTGSVPIQDPRDIHHQRTSLRSSLGGAPQRIIPKPMLAADIV